jgi:ATP-dependent Clp protease ATP-binding subunit ClpA
MTTLGRGESFFEPWNVASGFGPDVYEIVSRAAKIARCAASTRVEPEHLLASLLHKLRSGSYLLARCIMKPGEQFHDRAIRVLRRELGVVPVEQARRQRRTQVPLTAQAVRAIAGARDEARRRDQSVADSLDVALSILRHAPDLLRKRLARTGITYNKLAMEVRDLYVEGDIDRTAAQSDSTSEKHQSITNQSANHYPATPSVPKAVKHAEALTQSQGGRTLAPDALLAGIIFVRDVAYNILTFIADPGPDSAERPERLLRREFGGGRTAGGRDGANFATTATKGGKSRSSSSTAQPPRMPRSFATTRIFRHAAAEARNLGLNYIGTEHILLSLLQHADRRLLNRLAAVGVTYRRALRETRDLLGNPRDIAQLIAAVSGPQARSSEKKPARKARTARKAQKARSVPKK